MSTYVISSKLLNQSRELTPTEKVLVVAIQSLSKEKGYCYATNTYLADSLGKDKTTISKSLTSLEDKGFINRFIVRDDRKMVVERKVSLTKKFLSKFVEELVNAANNVAEATKQKATKVIRVSKKAIDKAKIVLNKKKEQQNKQEESNQDQQQHKAPVNPFEVGIPADELLNKDEVNVSDEVRIALKEKLNLNADKVIEELEKEKGTYEVVACINHVYEYIVEKKQSISSTNYLVSTFKNGFSSKCGGRRVVREENTNCSYFTRDENGNLICKYSDEPKQSEQPQSSCEHSLTDDDHAKIERMKVLQAQLLSGNFGCDLKK